MSKYKLSRKVTIDVIPSEPISKEGVAGARYAFQYHNAENADTLALHPSARMELHKIMDRNWLDIQSYQGLTVYLDPSLEKDEWRVRKTDERIEALK